MLLTWSDHVPLNYTMSTSGLNFTLRQVDEHLSPLPLIQLKGITRTGVSFQTGERLPKKYVYEDFRQNKWLVNIEIKNIGECWSGGFCSEVVLSATWNAIRQLSKKKGSFFGFWQVTRNDFHNHLFNVLYLYLQAFLWFHSIF